MMPVGTVVPENVHETPFLGPLVENWLKAGPPVERYRRNDDEGDTKPRVVRPVCNPSDVPDTIQVSGRIISATTNLPQVVVRDATSGKVGLTPRRGNSALYSAISYLHQDTQWESILVAWPGEVEGDHQLVNRVSTQGAVPRGAGGTSGTGDGAGAGAGTGTGASSTTEGTVVFREHQQRSANPHLTQKERDEVTAQLQIDNNGMKVVPIWMDPVPGSGSGLGSGSGSSSSDDAARWRAYAENVIWPALHYIQGEATDGRDEQQWWKDYVKLNEAYRDSIMSQYRAGDIILIHDYYLLLVPQMLRMRLPDASIGLYMHAPFPSSEYFRGLSKRQDLLEGMLGASLVGTQSSAYSRHFISSATRLLGVESSDSYVSACGVHVSVEALPIGIDTVKVEKDAFRQSVSDKVQAIRELYPDKKIIVGRDRLDSVRGVVQKLQAFELFLTKYPQYIGKVVLIQVTSPAYSSGSKTEKKVSELVARINGTFGSLHFAPVHHYPQHIARDEYFALLRVADLGLITSVRDGMNTTSLEFVVCQKENCSPVVLSEFTGTAGSLNDAIQVNPWDAIEVADTIKRCLELPVTDPNANRARQQKLYDYVTSHTVQHWILSLVSNLIHNLETHDRTHVTPMLDTGRLVDTYKSAKQRLFLFDYDGTLTPIVSEPSAAIPSARLYDVLDKLTQDPRNTVWVISGRDGDFLDRWLGSQNKKLGFSAEHGCFLKEVGQKEWKNLAAEVDMTWQKSVYEVFSSYTERTPGASIERKRASLTWHYRRADPDFGAFQASNLRAHLEETMSQDYNLEVMSGKANIEVRPREFNKGEIVKRIVHEFETRPDFMLCLGDDFTDEDMFRALLNLNEDADPTGNGEEPEGVFPVTVGPPSKMTVAKWHLLDPHSVLDSLNALVADGKPLPSHHFREPDTPEETTIAEDIEDERELRARK